MSGSSKISNLGAPVPVEVSAIEPELRRLWKTASSREGEAAVIRACSCNLVVFARDRFEAEALLPILAEISQWHPCRSLIACRESEEEDAGHPATPHMHAWISAQCSVPFAGGPQVCSEVITLSARSIAATDLLNTVVGLLIPDLRVFIYWRSFNEQDRGPIEHIARFAHTLIVDSHATKDDPAARDRLMELLLHPPAGIAVRDLNWARLNAWRDVVAQFFDNPALRHEVFEISEVEIERDIALTGNIPTRTLLLTGWLANRLGWRIVSTERRDDQWISNWRSRSGDVRVRFSGHASSTSRIPGISTILLKTRSGTTFRLVREEGSTHILATTTGSGPQLNHSVPQESMDEATLLVRELSLSGKDTSFQESLTEALALEKRFA
jgi:glucose-6-phosphate dehydrogenase assembly protein OpcA